MFKLSLFSEEVLANFRDVQLNVYKEHEMELERLIMMAGSPMLAVLTQT